MELSYNWSFFQVLYGKEGARSKFEALMADLLRTENPNKVVHRIDSSRGGDRGIDVYVEQGDCIDVYQCKFFSSPKLENPQMRQIIDSFVSLMNTSGTPGAKIVSKWILCIPHLMNPPEEEWFRTFQREKEGEENSKRKIIDVPELKIQYIDGDDIISRLEAAKLFDKYFAFQGSNRNDESITSDELAKYYNCNKETSVIWSPGDHRAPIDYLRLYGAYYSKLRDDMIDDVENIDLLDLYLCPSEATKCKYIGNAKFKVIYGDSNSGLTFLCKTAFQCFLHNRKTEFKNMAYFTISDEDLENENRLVEKLKIHGKSIFSMAFEDGLLIIDGLGKIFEKPNYNKENILKLIDIISYWSDKIPNFRVIITIRVDVERCAYIFDQIPEDSVCIQNLMLNTDEDDFQELIKKAELRDSLENRIIFNVPIWRRALENIINDRRSKNYTESMLIDQVLNAGISDNEKKQKGIICSDLAYGIFSKGYKYLFELKDNIDDFKDIPFIIIEGNKVGFKSRLIFDYYVADYYYRRLIAIDDGKDAINAFMKALSARILPDRAYNYEWNTVNLPDDESGEYEDPKEVEDESILCLLLERCLDECCNEDFEREILRRLGFMFYHISDGKLIMDYLNDFDGNSGAQTAIGNFLKIYRYYYSLSKESVKIFKPIFGTQKFIEQLMPIEIVATGGLDKAEFERDIFGIVKIGEKPGATDRDSLRRKKGKGKKYRKGGQSKTKYGSEVTGTSFCESVFRTIEIENAAMVSCQFDDIVVTECFETVNSCFYQCSFTGAKIERACFRDTIFYEPDFLGMKINKDAFNDAVIDDKDGKQISDEEWESMGVTFY